MPTVLVTGANRGIGLQFVRESCEIQLGDAWRVNLNDNLMQSLGAWLSEDNVKVLYS